MRAQKYIGGNFSADDSLSFTSSSSDWDVLFPETIRNSKRTFFETGIDALAAYLIRLNNSFPVYFPIHYCQESIDRLQFKIPSLIVERYVDLTSIPNSNAVVIWNHFNGYLEIPSYAFAKEHWTIVEDFVQAASDIRKMKGNTAFTSLRKWTEIDCSILYTDLDIETLITNDETDYFLIKKNAEELKSAWQLNPSKELENAYLEKFYEAEKVLHITTIAKANQNEIDKLKALNWTKIFQTRKENALFLKKKLKELNVDYLSNDSLFVIVLLDDRDAIKMKLATKGIFAPVHWLDSSDETIKHKILSLPIDHRYDVSNMEYLVESLYDALKNK